MSEPYQPVSCQLHSELELVIMHKQWIKIHRRFGDVETEDIILPYDIVSRSGEGEFLLAFNRSHEPVQFRLDHILRFKIIADQ